MDVNQTPFSFPRGLLTLIAAYFDTSDRDHLVDDVFRVMTISTCKSDAQLFVAAIVCFRLMQLDLNRLTSVGLVDVALDDWPLAAQCCLLQHIFPSTALQVEQYFEQRLRQLQL